MILRWVPPLHLALTLLLFRLRRIAPCCHFSCLYIIKYMCACVKIGGNACHDTPLGPPLAPCPHSPPVSPTSNCSVLSFLMSLYNKIHVCMCEDWRKRL